MAKKLYLGYHILELSTPFLVRQPFGHHVSIRVLFQVRGEPIA